jgi:hypothetical protein
MDILQLYQDFSIDFKTEGHKHTREGWVNVECPHCEGNAGYHLGYNLESNHYVCWRCGFHSVVPTLALLLHIKEREAYNIVSQYGLLLNSYVKPIASVTKIEHRWPSGVTTLTDRHKHYLEGRGFDPDYLEKKYGLMSSGPISLLDNINYKHRILIPYIWNYEQVSFDSRDVTGKDSNKYKACSKKYEVVSHKEILYGNQEKWKSSAVCVEGPTDVWRFGDYSFAVSGIKYTPKQVRLISKLFKRVPVCFDGGESQAIEQANKLVSELRFRGVDSFRVDIEGDPGAMDQKEANYLVKQLVH